MRARTSESLEAGPRVVRTRSGLIEYGEAGVGDVVLSIHGGGGGWDVGLLLAEHLAGDYRLIAPSRPGYLGTPIDSGRPFEEQARAMVSLMDALEVENAAVLAHSAGGPVGVLTAALFPERVWALITDSAVFLPYHGSRLIRPDSLVAAARESLALWLVRHYPRPLVRRLLGSNGLFDRASLDAAAAALQADPERLALLRRLREVLYPARRRWIGRVNDRQRMAQLDPLPLEQVRAPTLVCHGRLDGDVAIAQAEHAAARIPRAEAMFLERGIHVLCLSEDRHRVWDAQRAFLARHAPRPRRRDSH